MSSDLLGYSFLGGSPLLENRVEVLKAYHLIVFIVFKEIQHLEVILQLALDSQEVIHRPYKLYKMSLHKIALIRLHHEVFVNFLSPSVNESFKFFDLGILVESLLEL